MRTLATQMRLRRLLRTQAEYHRRLLQEERWAPLATAASSRLLQQLEEVRTSWNRESQGLELAGLRAYVSRSLAAMQAAAGALARPGADVAGLGAGFREVGLPLVFFLRGLDDSEAPVLAELTGQALPRSA